ncbi:hypothetical protein Poli38472_006790 [Pythium oligandrum]|uniref:Uncharacterized protein n=1 Tax=Pythium oligandrum TaxID=41045 RepID=A0A8K1C5L6_PYTOL|nr:hypothetical protein Poli38472_006790 [Pythium oligandrum]|eukprot:TMW56780.1 hypothetical protein Poli38472_006790 [Pythium oligandrum]
MAEAMTSCLEAYLRDSEDAKDALADAEDPRGFVAQLLLINNESDVTEAPSDPYACQVAQILTLWAETRHHPLQEQPAAIEGVTELTETRDHVLSVPLEAVQKLLRTCTEPTTSTQEKNGELSAFFRCVGGARGVLALLGHRFTVGSRTLCPLTRSQCITAFTQSHGREKLTVGARAFTKHCQRSSDGWWGAIKGNDAAKNATALAKLLEILDHAVWKNVHSLPHGEATFEVRNAMGYGARWYLRDLSFRGFLEPPMENGHENRWRH